jgi:predicted DNA-binding transcriptional regulator AlpA
MTSTRKPVRMHDLESQLRLILRSELDAALSQHLGKPPIGSRPPGDIETAARTAVVARIDEMRADLKIVFLNEASAMTGISRRKLYEMRLNGIGPASRKWGSRIGYDKDDVEHWMELRRTGIKKKVPLDIDLDEV